jgi:hypothetical protein
MKYVIADYKSASKYFDSISHQRYDDDFMVVQLREVELSQAFSSEMSVEERIAAIDGSIVDDKKIDTFKMK